MAVAERLRRILVEFACLACGDASEQLVADLMELGPLPRRCQRCGGSVLASAASTRYIANPAFRLNFWAPTGPPPRGRPRKVENVA